MYVLIVTIAFNALFVVFDCYVDVERALCCF